MSQTKTVNTIYKTITYTRQKIIIIIKTTVKTSFYTFDQYYTLIFTIKKYCIRDVSTSRTGDVS